MAASVGPRPEVARGRGDAAPLTTLAGGERAPLAPCPVESAVGRAEGAPLFGLPADGGASLESAPTGGRAGATPPAGLPVEAAEDPWGPGPVVTFVGSVPLVRRSVAVGEAEAASPSAFPPTTRIPIGSVGTSCSALRPERMGSVGWSLSASSFPAVCDASASGAFVARRAAAPGGVTFASSAAQSRHPSAWRRSRWASAAGSEPLARARAVFSSKQDTMGMFSHVAGP